MERTIDKYLIGWKNDPERLVLLVRGARQVGKTFSIRNLGKSFKHLLEINFEEQVEARGIFSGNLTVDTICEKLAAYYSMPIVPGETLLFFDEVQACPDCLRALRFFHERMPGLHVVATGSLLEFALAEIPSFGVGRILSAYMYPLSFSEFLRAEGSGSLWDHLVDTDELIPVDTAMHLKLLDRMRTYMLVGGMPAVTDSYVRNRDLRKCQELIGALISGLYSDFSKYGSRLDPLVLRDTFRSTGIQVGGKFKYAAIGADIPARSGKTALDLLQRAGLIHRICHSSSRGLPLGAGIERTRFKVIPMDIGIHQRMTGMDFSETLIADYSSLIHRGHLAEVFTGLQLLMSRSPFLEPELFYWHREGSDTNAEVDYVIQKEGRVVPVEVKSGLRGTMQSMRIFLKERELDYGIRLSQENVSQYENIRSYPLYLAGKIGREKSDDDA